MTNRAVGKLAEESGEVARKIDSFMKSSRCHPQRLRWLGSGQ